MYIRFLTALLLTSIVWAPAALARKWTDSTGNFSLEAELVDFKDGKVRLKRTDGKIITVAFTKLSKPDQEFLHRGDPSAVKLIDLTGKPRMLSNDDGKPGGKKSFPRGHASAFEAPQGTWYLTSVRIHGGRYGYPTPPKEDFHVTLCNPDFKPLADFPFAYKLFQRGPQKWVTLRTKPTEVPAKFVICVNFNAERTKGVYVSHDAEGKSLVGLPDKMSGYFTGGDWMIRVNLDQRKEDAAKPAKPVREGV